MDITKHYEAVATSHQTLAGYFVKALMDGLDKAGRGEIGDEEWEQFWDGLVNCLALFAGGRLHTVHEGYARHTLTTTMAILPELLRWESIATAQSLAEVETQGNA